MIRWIFAILIILSTYVTILFLITFFRDREWKEFVFYSFLLLLVYDVWIGIFFVDIWYIVSEIINEVTKNMEIGDIFG